MIRGQGMPSYRHHEPGDLYVRLNVVFPERLNPAFIPQLEQILPPRKPVQMFPKTTMLKGVNLSILDARQASAAQRNADDKDDADDKYEADEGRKPRV